MIAGEALKFGLGEYLVFKPYAPGAPIRAREVHQDEAVLGVSFRLGGTQIGMPGKRRGGQQQGGTEGKQLLHKIHSGGIIKPPAYSSEEAREFLAATRNEGHRSGRVAPPCAPGKNRRRRRLMRSQRRKCRSIPGKSTLANPGNA